MHIQKLPEVFSKEELVRLYEKITDVDVMIGVTLALFCALRLGEVIRLKKEQVNFETRKIKVVDSKNPLRSKHGYGKDRYVPMPSCIVEPLRKWFDVIKDEVFVIPTIRKKDSHLHAKHLFRKYTVALRKAKLHIPVGVDKIGRTRYKYNFHTLRHTAATRVWEKQGDIYAVKKFLGHGDIKTSQIYTHVSDPALQEKIDNAFNMDGFDINLVKKPVKEEKNNYEELEKIRLENESMKLKVKALELQNEQLRLMKELNPLKVRREDLNG